MASISEKEIRKAVKGVLKGADLSSLSVKKIRLKLEEKFKADFSDRKKEVDGIVMEILAAGNQDSDDEEQEDVVKQEQVSSDSESGQSENGRPESDKSDSEIEDTPPKKKAKKEKKKKEKTLEDLAAIDEDFDPEDPDKMNDEEIARQLQDTECGPRRSGRLGRTYKKKEKKHKEPKKDGERKAKGYGAPCQLSPALAEIMGTDKMPRCDVVKKMYDIAKERNLLDPSNKQFMICNDELFKVFGKKRVRMFGMMKHLTDHITDPHKMVDS